jgi:predicted amidohydrolase YtcJ
MVSHTILIRGAEVRRGRIADIRLGVDRIEEVGTGLARRQSEEAINARGRALIPGLHDHHVHLRSVVASRMSVDVSHLSDQEGAAGFDRLLRSVLRSRPGPATQWLRVVGWDEWRLGPLDRRRLDALAGSVPVRVQHRSGAMWVLNSAALAAVGAAACDLPGVEQDAGGLPTGRLLRMDEWLRDRLPDPAQRDDWFERVLADYAGWCASLGITGFTDATPGRHQADVEEFARLAAGGAFPQRVMLMAPPGLQSPEVGSRVTLGPMKVMLDDLTLPDPAELAADIVGAHAGDRAVAVHCVSAEQIVVAVAAFEQAGSPPAGVGPDRIEHAGIVPPGYAERLAQLALAVVTQPAFITVRGDDYRRDVPSAEQDWLYPCASLLRAGVAVAAGTDAPFGSPDPWRAVSAAVTRRTCSDAVLGPAERVRPEAALRLFLADPADVRRIRRIAPGQPADVCLLRTARPPRLSELSLARAALIVVSGEVTRRAGDE